jgi:ABC-type transport system involved in cytochrome c biogenesis permease component
MEARLEARRSPAIALVFALVVTMLLGATIGYLLKPISTVAGPIRYIAVTITQATPNADACVFINGHKGC